MYMLCIAQNGERFYAHTSVLGVYKPSKLATSPPSCSFTTLPQRYIFHHQPTPSTQCPPSQDSHSRTPSKQEKLLSSTRSSISLSSSYLGKRQSPRQATRSQDNLKLRSVIVHPQYSSSADARSSIGSITFVFLNLGPGDRRASTARTASILIPSSIHAHTLLPHQHSQHLSFPRFLPASSVQVRHPVTKRQHASSPPTFGALPAWSDSVRVRG